MMEEGLRSIDGCKGVRVELDLNVEPVEEAEDVLITTEDDSLGNKGGDGFGANADGVNDVGFVAALCDEESKVMKCGVDGDDTNNVDPPCKPRGRRGRKRKKDDELLMMSNGREPGKEEPITSQETEAGRGCLKAEGDGSEQIRKVDDHVGEPLKKRRGRKRKNIENNQSHTGEVKRMKDNHLAPSGTTGVVGKVLRSRTIDGNLDSKSLKPEIDQSNKPIKKRDVKKMKGRRGRPPKVQSNDVLAQVKAKDEKKVKGRRGRPPKIPAEDVVSGIVDSQKGKVKTKKVSKKAGDVIKSSMFGKAQQESTESQLVKCENKRVKMCKNLKEGDASRRVQQQAVRDQIVDILMKAGWTVEYRPRVSKDYSDAVYKDVDGKTHWSVTLAYRKLKEKVDSGNADDKALSAFTVIPEEVLGTLFRTRQKKEKSGGKKGKKKNTKLNEKNDDDHSMKTSAKGRPRSKKDGRNRKQCALRVRRSGDVSDQDGDGFVLYDGKRSLLSWMMDCGTVQSSAQVQYMNAQRTKVMLEGKITGDGICCDCCGQTLTLSDFESHAGSSVGQPLKHICLESGVSLLQCLADLWSKQEESNDKGFHLVHVDADDPNDDTCNICADGGDLICCDSCPSTFHQNCLNLNKLPSGNWRCVYCSCKFCGIVAGKPCHVDEHVAVSELSSCHLCEEKFHFACNQGEAADSLNSEDVSFCGKGCEKLFEGIRALLGVKHQLDEGFSWTILHRSFVGQDVTVGSDNSSKIECNSKLSVAFSVMDECFMPIVDQRSGANMIHNVIYNYGSNFRRLNYRGFYTVILEKGDELVAAASIRLHGSELAEMPFIGTRYRYRRQGMCRRLIGGIETALSSLGVEKLVIPAIPELVETWTNIFGFVPLEESKRREMMHMSMVVFPGTDMLQKPVPKHQVSEDHITTPGCDTEASAEIVPEKNNVVTVDHPVESCVSSSHVKTGFESFIPKEALSVQ